MLDAEPLLSRVSKASNHFNLTSSDQVGSKVGNFANTISCQCICPGTKFAIGGIAEFCFVLTSVFVVVFLFPLMVERGALTLFNINGDKGTPASLSKSRRTDLSVSGRGPRALCAQAGADLTSPNRFPVRITSPHTGSPNKFGDPPLTPRIPRTFVRIYDVFCHYLGV